VASLFAFFFRQIEFAPRRSHYVTTTGCSVVACPKTELFAAANAKRCPRDQQDDPLPPNFRKKRGFLHRDPDNYKPV
jgi:hypothetical protein